MDLASLAREQGRVMVVDENGGHADDLAFFLGRRGFEVRTAGEQGDAIVLAQSWIPDAAVVATPLAGAAAFPLARHLRDSLGPELRLVAMSEWTAAADHERLAQAGFDRVLARYARPEELLEALSAPTRRLALELVRASERRMELVIALGHATLDSPLMRNEATRERVLGNVRRLVAILDRDWPHLPAGEVRDRFRSRIEALARRAGPPLA
jgi:DNA-binding response OmpR family regulator